jgi:hypothetical protein
MIQVVRIDFGAIAPPPAPFFVAWFESDEMFYVCREDDENFEGGPYCTKWMARKAAVASALQQGSK